MEFWRRQMIYLELSEYWKKFSISDLHDKLESLQINF